MLTKADALIWYHTGKDPDLLDDTEWANLFKGLEWAREEERKRSGLQ